MPTRKGSFNTLVPPEVSPSPSSPKSPARSPSPGLGNFLSKPSKWFKSGSSTSRAPPTTVTAEPRPSDSSARKVKISKPTDPRPIIQSLKSDSYVPTSLGSRSVADLSTTSVDLSSAPPLPSSSGARSIGSLGSLGDLRGLSSKAWSKSADDLLDVSVPISPLTIDTTLFGRIEQYRQKSSPTSAGPDPSAQQHPFPTSLAASPPNESPISTSPPPTRIPKPSPSSPGTHVHTRSYSFTSRLSSKLGPLRSTTDPPPPMLTRPLLPSPSPTRDMYPQPRDRKRTGSSDHPSSISSGPSIRPGFPWHNSSSSNPGSPDVGPPSPRDFPVASRKTMMLSPPIIIEPEPEEEKQEEPTPVKSRRTSQIVHLSGFLNRMTNFVPPGEPNASTYWSMTPTTSLAKGWKPFKAELKGSKLYFYKPPSDHVAGIKMLFPDTITAELSESDAFAPPPVTEPQDSRRRDDGRMKRAYWGRGPHPELVLGAGTPRPVQRGTLVALVHEAVFGSTFRECSTLLLETMESKWKELASAIILCVPQVVERGRFEAEFMRCCENLVTGADEDAKGYEVARSTWLAQTYLDIHGKPIDEPAWDKWRSEVIPHAQLQSSPPPESLTPRRSTTYNDASRRLLSTDDLVRIDRHLIARSLSTFHQLELTKLPDTVSLSMCLEPWSVPSNGAAGSADRFASGLALFSGGDERAHWLSLFVMYHLFIPDSVGSQNTVSNRPAARHGLPSRLTFWIIVGELCRRNNDMCSWQAIRAALCSAPVARMGKLWQRISLEFVRTVEIWVAESKPAESLKTPWLADKPDAIHDDLAQLLTEESSWDVVTMLRVHTTLGSVNSSIKQCFSSPAEEASRDMLPLLALWENIILHGPGQAASVKMIRLAQALSLSNALEPRHRGMVEPLYWTNPMIDRSPHPIVPLLFPEALPTITLLDRQLLLPARTETSASTLSIADINFFRDCRTLIPMERKSKLSFGGSLDAAGTIIQVDEELLVNIQATQDVPSSSVSKSRAPSRAPSRAASRVPSQTSSRAPSRTPSTPVVGGAPAEKTIARKASMRMRPASPTTLERKTSKTSISRRNSLPSLKPKPSLVTIHAAPAEKPLRVVVHAATLDRLVKLLVFGLERVVISASDDVGESSLHEKTSRELQLDSQDFADTWWFSFRNFVTPLVFFELLRKEYISASSSGTSSSESLKARIAVLGVLESWISVGSGSLDILNNIELQTAVATFLKPESYDVPSSEDEAQDTVQLRPAFDAAVTSLRDAFRTYLERPPLQDDDVQPRESNSDESEVANGTRGLPNIDNISAEGLVDQLDLFAQTVLNPVLDEDLVDAVELIEVQTMDPTGWLMPQDPTTTPDDIEIQTIYSCLYNGNIEPAPVISELGQDQFYRLLPTSIRTCIRAHEMLRKWLLSKIVERGLGTATRQARMEKILQALELTRSTGFSVTTPTQPAVRSFAEVVLTAVLVSPGSRAHTRAWVEVASARNRSPESVMSIMSDTLPATSRRAKPLTTDFGWLLERMLEAISLPNAVEENGKPFINLDKRRLALGLVRTIQSASRTLGRARARKVDAEMEKLQMIEKEVMAFDFDLRSIRSDAIRDGSQTPSSKKGVRPFGRLVLAQHEKNRRDRSLRDRLIKEKRAEQQRSEKREHQLDRAMQVKARPNAAGRGQHRTKKSTSSAFAFLQFMRPISTAFSSDSMTSNSSKRTAEELDFVPSGKPSLVLTVADAKMLKFINNERPYTFQVDTDDGGHYLFQATNQKEMSKWMSSVGHISQVAAKRRLTWIGDAPQLQDHVSDRPKVVAKEPTAVFGVDLTALLRRENHGQDPPAGTLPLFVQACLTEIESRGFSEVGIYRIAGSKAEINGLVDVLNRGAMPINSSLDIYAVCDLLKMWLRQLPEATFPSSTYQAAITVGGIKDLDARIQAVRELVHELPQAHFDLLKRLSEHFYEVTESESVNQMSEGALAIVLHPNLLQAPDFGIAMRNMGAASTLVRTLISHFHVIFEDSAELEDDDTEASGLGDGYIIEEDEEDLNDDNNETTAEAGVSAAYEDSHAMAM